MGALRTTWTAQLHPTSNLQNCLGVTGDRWEPLCEREAEGMGNCTVNLAHSSAYFTHSVFSVRKNHKHPPDFSETASCGVRWSPHFTGVCPPVWPSPSPFLPSYAQLLHLFTLPCLVAVTLEFMVSDTKSSGTCRVPWKGYKTPLDLVPCQSGFFFLILKIAKSQQLKITNV